jgi:serine/threonine-protein kinase
MLAGRYRLEQQIGEGGVATVWRAWDTVLERPVAVKVLRPELARDAGVVARFRREAHAAAKLNHPHIVQIYDTGQDEAQGLYFLVMEFLPEPDLKRIINEYAPLPSRKVIEVAIQCCRALAYAHRQGLVHRDVKPHNILFTDEGIAKLSDFGIAAAVGETGTIAPGLIVGSAAYLSPEQAQGKPVGPQSDLYSLGCVMFEALAARPPFVGDSAAAVAAMHVHERVPSPRTFNPAVTAAEEFVLMKALARETGRRYQSAEQMLADLTKLAAGEELDRTGVIARTEERTIPLRVTPGPVAPGPVLPVPVAARPGTAGRSAARPGSAARPLPENRDSSLVGWTILLILLTVVALVGAAFLVKYAFYPSNTPKLVQVPALRGHAEADAQLELTEAGLKLGQVTWREDRSAPKGTVLAQSPAEGQSVPAGTSVSLEVNRGVETAPVPDLTGTTKDEAAAALTAAGLVMGQVTQVASDTIPAGQVVDQKVAPGVTVAQGTSVAVTVSSGPVAPAAAPPVTGGPPAASAPMITCLPDESYHSSNPREHRYTLSLTATGEEQGQKIRVVKQEEGGTKTVIYDDVLNPGQTASKTFNTTGNASLQVYQDGQKGQEIPLAVPAKEKTPPPE